MNGRTAWQASPISTTPPWLRWSLRGRSWIGGLTMAAGFAGAFASVHTWHERKFEIAKVSRKSHNRLA
jgi:hypothetical protein